MQWNESGFQTFLTIELEKLLSTLRPGFSVKLMIDCKIVDTAFLHESGEDHDSVVQRNILGSDLAGLDIMGNGLVM